MLYIGQSELSNKGKWVIDVSIIEGERFVKKIRLKWLELVGQKGKVGDRSV